MKKLEMLNCSYWDDFDRQAAENAKNFGELAEVGIRILQRMRKVNPDIIMIAGPMWSGLLSPEENHEIFEKATKAFVSMGYHIFKQMPFQDAMKRIQKIHGYEYPNKELLEEFYGVIFATKLIKKIAFIPGWSHSYGCAWEYDESLNYGIIRKILPKNYLKTLASGKKIRGL